VAGADFLVDFQTMAWAAGKAGVAVVERMFGLVGSRPALRVAAVYAVLGVALALFLGAAVLTRSLRGPRGLAVLGLALLLVLIGMRVAPPGGVTVPRTISDAVEWVCAADAVLLAAAHLAGLGRLRRRASRSGRPAPA
jgi:hypothetical protein